MKTWMKWLLLIGVAVEVFGCAAPKTAESLREEALHDQSYELYSQALEIDKEDYKKTGKFEYLASMAQTYRGRAEFTSNQSSIKNKVEDYSMAIAIYEDRGGLGYSYDYWNRAALRGQLQDWRGAESDWTKVINIHESLYKQDQNKEHFWPLKQAYGARSEVRKTLGDTLGANADLKFQAFWDQRFDEKVADFTKNIGEYERVNNELKEDYRAGLERQRAEAAASRPSFSDMQLEADKRKLDSMNKAYNAQQNRDADSRAQQKRIDCNVTGRSGGYDC